MFKKVKVLLFVILVVSLFQLRTEVAAKLGVEMQDVKLKGYLEKEYVAKSFNITNSSSNKIKVSNVHFTGDRNSDSASNDAVENSGNEVAIVWAVGIGLFWLFFIPVLIALVATPFILITKGSKKKKTRLESYMLGEKGPREVEISGQGEDEIVALFPEELPSTRFEFDYTDLTTGAVEHYKQKFVFAEL